MNFLVQRGAQPIKLDRDRVIFFSLASTFLLVQRFGIAFASELYEVDGKVASIASLRLKSMEALQFFLWAGLQPEAEAVGETLTLEQAGELIQPWSLVQIFTRVVLALTGATYTPEPTGKEQAASPVARLAAKKRAGKKVLTIKMRSGSPMRR